MATAACHPAQADHFLRRARAATAGRPPPKRLGRKPMPHPGRHCAAAHSTLPRPQPLIRRHFDIPAGASRNLAVFAAAGCRTLAGHHPLPRQSIRAAFHFRRFNLSTFRSQPNHLKETLPNPARLPGPAAGYGIIIGIIVHHIHIAPLSHAA